MHKDRVDCYKLLSLFFYFYTDIILKYLTHEMMFTLELNFIA